MSELKFVTSNKGKAIEIINALDKAGIKVVHQDMRYPEIRAETFEDVVKASVTYLRSAGLENFIVDDSGLRIESLNGFPGVYSSYVFKTIGCGGILRILAGSRDRRAEFVTVIGGYVKGNEITLTGKSKGTITMSQKGSFGFGYDPIFLPDGETRTYAEMPTDQKNSISHRGRAITSFIDWYEKQ